MNYIKILKSSELSAKKIAEKLRLSERAVQTYLSGKREVPNPTKLLIEYVFTDKHNKEVDKSEVDKLKKEISSLKSKLKYSEELIGSLKMNCELLQEQKNRYNSIK
jgi:predicted transcriptional regulator